MQQLHKSGMPAPASWLSQAPRQPPARGSCLCKITGKWRGGQSPLSSLLVSCFLGTIPFPKGWLKWNGIREIILSKLLGLSFVKWTNTDRISCKSSRNTVMPICFWLLRLWPLLFLHKLFVCNLQMLYWLQYTSQI